MEREIKKPILQVVEGDITGIFGFPMNRAARIMLETAINYLKGVTNLKMVIFYLFGKDSLNLFERELEAQIEEKGDLEGYLSPI